MLRTAIDLKEAIDNVEANVNPIGTCPLDILSWKQEHGGYYEENQDQGDSSDNLGNITQSDINDIISGLKTKYYSESRIKGHIHINYENFDYDGDLDIPQDKLKDLFTIAPDAPYGDNRTLETKIDKEVRDAKDISLDHFTIDPSVIQQISDLWSRNLYPKNVIVKPYKINLYGKNGHFDRHKDTPDKDMVGTGLIALTESSSALTIHSVDLEDKYRWIPRGGDCIVFYTDCEHQVNRVWNNDIRATLAFKIYSDEENSVKEEDVQNDQINQVSNTLEKLNLKNVGFLLGHGYSLQTEAFKGKDHLLVKVLTKMGKQFKVIPIIHKWYVNSWHSGCSEEDDISSNVYPFTEEHIDAILNNHDLPSDNNDIIKFYSINGSDYVWKDERQEYIEYTGNESLPEEQNSIYLSRALIFQ